MYGPSHQATGNDSGTKDDGRRAAVRGAYATYEVRVGGHQVRCQVAGGGETVILVHGLSGSTRWWSRNVSEIARRYRVYLVDLPGFGAAAPPSVRPRRGAVVAVRMEAVGGAYALRDRVLAGYKHRALQVPSPASNAPENPRALPRPVHGAGSRSCRSRQSGA
jgi:hypothetical protein